MVGKQDWLVKTLKEEIDALYADGRTTVMGEEELEALVKSHINDERSSLRGMNV